MNILLVDVDGTIPNLALMKISAWHKERGDTTTLAKSNQCIGRNRYLTKSPYTDGEFDKAYISCIFKANKPYVDGMITFMKSSGIEFDVGGVGYDMEKDLTKEIEHIMPDYDLYDEKYSMGYTSRGCIRSCDFCVVSEKEGMIYDNASISEFWDESHDKVVLLDNNFLAAPKWEEALKFIYEHDLKVNFNQGLDIRLVNDKNAKALSKLRIENITGKTDQVHFAFDDIRYEKAVRKGVATLVKHGIKARRLMVYMLIGYNSTFKEDMYRFKVLRELGTDPFTMKFVRTNRLVNDFSNWVNGRVYKVCEWNEYSPLDNYVYNEDKLIRSDIDRYIPLNDERYTHPQQEAAF